MSDDHPQSLQVPPQEHPLFHALKLLAEDLRALFDLATREDIDSWNASVAMAKRELEVIRTRAQIKEDDLLLYQSLVQEVYDHLTMLVETMKSTQERYKRLATRDLLTGLYNRNYFNETIVRDIERAARYGERLSFILIDVNDFKRINDSYGHLHGDGVLRACADILRSAARKSDFLCRYGGDEFVIVTPRPACDENNKLLARIEELLAEWNSRFAALDYRLSFSFGCAVWQQGRDVVEVLHEADQEMYKDKKRRKG